MTEKLEPGLEQVEIKQTRTAPNPIRFNNATINKIRASQYNFGSKNFLFIPFDFIRLEISNWLFQNAINFSLILVISGALIYWTLQLLKFDKSGEENKDVTAHSFL